MIPIENTNTLAVTYHPLPWQRLFQRLAALRPCSWALSHLLSRLDGWELRRTHGEHSLTTRLTGLPLITLHTTGTRSGLPRSTYLVAVPYDNNIVLIASYFGSSHHPAWYHNLIADPHARVSLHGQTVAYLARQTSGAQREACWLRAVSLYPGFEAYRRRARGREIPVMLLEPHSPDSSQN
jgi:deazaflavin-dependent oxidoreductase (nitroreductase family)